VRLIILCLLAFGCGALWHRGYYHTERISDGQVRVVCDNGADATIRPTSQFGSIIVDCGTR
jgi:hypothetical protein